MYWYRYLLVHYTSFIQSSQWILAVSIFWKRTSSAEKKEIETETWRYLPRYWAIAPVFRKSKALVIYKITKLSQSEFQSLIARLSLNSLLSVSGDLFHNAIIIHIKKILGHRRNQEISVNLVLLLQGVLRKKMNTKQNSTLRRFNKLISV